MLDMYKTKIGFVPTKRAHLSLDEAIKQKNAILKQIRSTAGTSVEFVDIHDINDTGILWNPNELGRVESHLKSKGIQGLFMPHCDFGTEEVVGRLAKAMNLPLLIWGPRDEAPDAVTGERKSDTQCGIFASSKVLQRYGIPFSYIINSEISSNRFKNGFEKFLGTVSVVNAFSKLRIAQIGSRPKQFMSVIYNEEELLNKFGIEIVPISIFDIMHLVTELIDTNSSELESAVNDITQRIDCTLMSEEYVRKIAALKLSLLKLINDNGCSAAALECWSIFPKAMGIIPCLVVSELTDMGIPIACETDVQGAVTSIMLQAAARGASPTFFADLTIRHPENDNAELLWHCGPFPYSIKAEESSARLEDGRAQWKLKDGPITIARFDSIEGQYSLFTGEAKTVEGPMTKGTYVWIEVDNWNEWEEKLIFGPYIHHVVGIHGKYAQVLLEACKYIPGLKADAVKATSLSL